MEKLKKAQEIADYLDTNIQRVYELTRRDLIPHIKIADRQYRYSLPAIQKWIDDGGNSKAMEVNKDEN